MKRELRDRWVAALRSGQYKQGIRFLRDAKDNFCCLGVLCDISGRGDWRPWNHLYEFKIDDYTSTMTLPDHDKFLTLIRFEENGSIQEKLMTMNDTGGTFTEIADWIERNVPTED